jgi:predicted ferric reductase
MSQLPWYVARAAGLLSWALVTASVLWGLLISTKATTFGHRPRPAWLLDLHRFLGGLASIFVGVHVVAIVLDSYVHFTLLSVLVPFVGSWKPTAVAWGIAGMYLLAAVELTSLARKRLPRRVWRVTHLASFPLFVVASVHGVTAGTDATNRMFVLVVAAAAAAIAGLTALRVQQSMEPSRLTGAVRQPA